MTSYGLNKITFLGRGSGGVVPPDTFMSEIKQSMLGKKQALLKINNSV